MPMASPPLPVGKLPPQLLVELLQHAPGADPRVLVGPRVGCDVAVIDFGDRLLVAKSDPITFATDAAGYYAVHVNANDVATSGAVPRWMLATVLLPEGSATERLAADLFRQIVEACTSIGVTLVGGHTEITYGLDRPIICGQMLGEVERCHLVTAAGAQPGDVVLVTKAVPVEGTSLIAREKGDELRRRGYREAEVERGRQMLYDPGISVLREAQIALAAGGVHALHDPTEGGIVTGLWELAEAGGLGLEVYPDAIPVDPLGGRLCAEFGLDPLGTIASGSLLIAAPEADARRICEALEGARLPCRAIGRVTGPEAGRQLVSGRPDSPVGPADRTPDAPDATTRELLPFARDEIAKLFT